MQLYTTLKEISESENINYHTLRRRALKRGVAMKRMGWQLFIKKTDKRKLIGEDK